MRSNGEIPMEVRTRDADSRGRVALGSEFADREVTLAILGESPDAQLDDLNVLHARHKDIGLTERGFNDLYADRRFGIDWSTKHTHPSVYEDKPSEGAGWDIDRLHRVSQHGALVTVENRVATEEFLLVGVVEPGTPIELIEYDHTKSGSHYLKVLQLKDAVEIPLLEDGGNVLEDRPPRGSLREWNDEFKDSVRTLYQNSLEDRRSR